MKTILLILLLICSGYAKTVHIQDYATPNDNTNDTAEFQDAISDLKSAGGGTLIIDEGTWDLQGQVTMTDSGNDVSYLIIGNKGAVIDIDGSDTSTMFYGGNINHVEFRDLIFTGQSTGWDVGTLAFFAYTHQVKITGCQFYGVKATTALINTTNVDTLIADSLFHGSSGGVATVLASSTDMKSLTVRDTMFIDFGSFKGIWYSKMSGQPWIKATGHDTTNAMAANVTIERCRFDEGALVAVTINDVPTVTITGCAFNVSPGANGAGIRLAAVPYGLITASSFGYSANARPGIILADNSHITASRLRFGNGVYFSDVDGTSLADIGYCPEC